MLLANSIVTRETQPENGNIIVIYICLLQCGLCIFMIILFLISPFDTAAVMAFSSRGPDEEAKKLAKVILFHIKNVSYTFF